MKPIEMLKEDFSQTLGFIDKCDDHIFKIKNWALLTWVIGVRVKTIYPLVIGVRVNGKRCRRD